MGERWWNGVDERGWVRGGGRGGGVRGGGRGWVRESVDF